MDERVKRVTKMKIEDIEEYSKSINGKIEFDYDISNLNWFNIGGRVKVFFKPESLQELIDFLKVYNNREKIFLLGAGSNTLFTDKSFNGVVIKLGKKFSNISKLNEETIIAGSSALDKTVSQFAKENNIGGLEFLSCIPGSIGGGIRMNAGCFEKEFKDVLLSIQFINTNGVVSTVPVNEIDFKYRSSNLDKSLIFLSATLKGFKTDKLIIEKEIYNLTSKKKISQPSKIKTGGSTFKNPKDQTKKKVWELIKDSVPIDTKIGDAEISKKHCNFFVNVNKAKFEDMKSLINLVKDKVKEKTGISIETEIVVVE